MNAEINTILNGVILAILLWNMRALVDVRERVARIEGVLQARRITEQEKNYA